MRDLEKSLKLKTKEIEQLKKRLKTEQEKHRVYTQKRKIDLEELVLEEKQIYDQKLNSMRVHFNQQIKLIEQNERNMWQDKLNNLQKLYNDIKLNCKKNLDNECKQLKLKLAESQAHTTQLAKQLKSQLNTNKKVCTNSTSTQTSECLRNDSYQHQQPLNYLNKMKTENSELKYQIECERRHFRAEKEKWLSEKHKIVQSIQNSNPNNTTIESKISNPKRDSHSNNFNSLNENESIGKAKVVSSCNHLHQQYPMKQGSQLNKTSVSISNTNIGKQHHLATDLMNVSESKRLSII